MPRSPLASWFRRIYRQRKFPAAADVGQGFPDAPLTRRDFLARAAAAALLPVPLALAGCAPERSAANARVVVIGAGIAGLTCAWWLARNGVRAEVYDASAVLGGRILTDRATFAGIACELGGEFIDTDHVTMRRLAHALGIGLADVRSGDEQEMFQAYVDGVVYPRSRLVADFAPIAQSVDDCLGRLSHPDDGVTWDNPNGAEDLDRLSIRAWLDQVGARGPVRRLLEVVYREEFGLDIERSNALNLLLTLGRNNRTLEVYGASDERFHAVGGNAGFIAGLLGQIPEAQIHREHSLDHVALRADGVFSAAFSAPGGAVEILADQLVLALPFTVLRRIGIDVDLPARKRRAIAELGYGTNAKVLCGYSARAWNAAGMTGITYADLPYQSSWDASRHQPGAGGVITAFGGGSGTADFAQGTPAEVAAAFVQQIDRVMPGTAAQADGRCARAVWDGNARPGGSYSAYLVGQYTAFAGIEGERVGNLHFAGEHASVEAQGYMEGGAETGLASAQRIVHDLLGRKQAPEDVGPMAGG